MKLKAYRWTKLSEALNIMQKKKSRKYSYRITDKEEANIYAWWSKWFDKYTKAAIIEAEIDIPKDVLRTITPQEYEELHEKKSKRLKNKIGVYKVGNAFSLILISPQQMDKIKNPKIVSVI